MARLRRFYPRECVIGMSDKTHRDMADETGEALGVILRAENGDVIRYDETGLILRLSDRVVADIAARIGAVLPASGGAATGPAAGLEGALPDEVDAWDLRADGDWLRFTASLPGRQGARGFRRHRSGGAILADARGPLNVLLGIGGARAALGLTDEASHYPHHILSPADDIGAVGHAGIEVAAATEALEPVRDKTHEVLVAERLLDRRLADGLALPLIAVRVETDESHDARALAQGRAVANLDQAAKNLVRAAARLGTHAKLLAVTLDYALEDQSGDRAAYRDGMIAVMEEATVRLGKLGFAQPLFLATFDCGTHRITESPALAGQWDLSWNHAAHRLTYVAPGYAFAQDATARLTADGCHDRAVLYAAALQAVEADGDWRCPVIHLAEAQGQTIRAVCASALELVIDKADPFGAGKTAGFRLVGAGAPKILKVEIDPADDKAVLLHCSAPVPATGVKLAYAYGAPAGEGPFPPNSGALRDSWSGSAGTRPLHRWALPALLPVQPAGRTS